MPPAFIAGAGTASYATRIEAAQTVLMIHFRPGEGSALHERLTAAPSAPERIALLESFLLYRMRVHDLQSHRALGAWVSNTRVGVLG